MLEANSKARIAPGSISFEHSSVERLTSLPGQLVRTPAPERHAEKQKPVQLKKGADVVLSYIQLFKY